MTIRFKFSRASELKYISHLDILRLFERSIKRARIPVAYSQGFNPRQKMVFGLPMSIGLTSESEYADIDLSEDISTEEFIEAINKGLPEGIKVLEAVILTSKGNIMNQIKSARYKITFEIANANEVLEINDYIQKMLTKDEIIVMKKSKRGEKPVDIKPLIYSISATKKDNNQYLLEAFISAGTKDNLRADLLMRAFSQKTGLDITIVSQHRKALYTSVSNKWKDPFEVAND